MSRFHKLLFNELRILESKQMENKVSKGNIELALIDNENLKALGYELTNEGIVKLSQDYHSNPNMQPLYKIVMELEPSIEISPMYPNFPKQVIDMDEMTYRTHQVMHYISTYGLESILGVEMKEGWLPETTVIEKRVDDIQVAELKTIDYLSELEIEQFIIKNLIERNERLQPRETELAKAVLLKTDLIIENVPFKDNIGAIYGDVLLTGELKDRYKVLYALSNIIKHPGDVLDLTEYMVVKNKYKHLKTSVKRGLVELIEQFSYAAIEENLASNRWSNRFLGKGGKPRSINRNIALIDYLSFNRFSTNEDAKKLVNELKNGKLLSWNQKLEIAYSDKDYELAIELLSQRPGILFRQVNRLISLGVSPNEISIPLKKSADKLKTQTIVSAINNFEDDEKVKRVFLDTLICNLMSKNIEEMKNKKIYIDEGNVDFSRSKINITDKFAEGGYISNGMAIKIPENAEFLRFFTHWNDKQRIDIDLHGMSIDKDGNSEHIGWNGWNKSNNLVHSGDITHSNATEYVDLNLSGAIEDGLERVQFNINSYTGVPFANIETVFTGLMLLSELGEKVNLFDSKNVIFRHDLESKYMSIDYGMIDLINKLIYVGGKPSGNYNDTNLFEIPKINLDIKKYLSLLILIQGGTITTNKENADFIVGLAKSDQENYISLIDNNFFMD